MARALNKNTMEYLESVHSPTLDTDIWMINPDLSRVKGIDKKYWKIASDMVLPMTTEEMLNIDSLVVESPIRKVSNKSEREYVFRSYGSLLPEYLHLNPGVYSLKASLSYSGTRSNETILFSLFLNDVQLEDTEVYINTGGNSSTRAYRQAVLFDDITITEVTKVYLKGRSSIGSIVVCNVHMVASANG